MPIRNSITGFLSWAAKRIRTDPLLFLPTIVPVVLIALWATSLILVIFWSGIWAVPISFTEVSESTRAQTSYQELSCQNIFDTATLDGFPTLVPETTRSAFSNTVVKECQRIYYAFEKGELKMGTFGERWISNLKEPNVLAPLVYWSWDLIEDFFAFFGEIEFYLALLLYYVIVFGLRLEKSGIGNDH